MNWRKLREAFQTAANKTARAIRALRAAHRGFASLGSRLAPLTHIAPARESSGTRIRSYGRAQRHRLRR